MEYWPFLWNNKRRAQTDRISIINPESVKRRRRASRPRRSEGLHRASLIRRILELPGDLIDTIVTMTYNLALTPLRIAFDETTPSMEYGRVWRGWAGRRTNPGFIRAQQVELSGGRWLIDYFGFVHNSVDQFNRIR